MTATATSTFSPGNPVLSSYIPWPYCGLYYCSSLSALINIPSLSDFVFPCPFRKGLFLLPVNFGGQLPPLLCKLYAFDNQIFYHFFQFFYKRKCFFIPIILCAHQCPSSANCPYYFARSYRPCFTE